MPESDPGQRRGDRRQSRDRRGGTDRRSGVDRRKVDLGGADGIDRRTGWDRRISERRAKDRRTGRDRRRPPDDPRRPTLHAVALGYLRQLVSRLYFKTSRAPRPSERARDTLGELRKALLTPEPDLRSVHGKLRSLKRGAVAKFPEFGLALELLSEAGAGASTSPLRRRDSLERLQLVLAQPLPPKGGTATAARRSKRTKGSSKKKPDRKRTKRGRRKS